MKMARIWSKRNIFKIHCKRGNGKNIARKLLVLIV